MTFPTTNGKRRLMFRLSQETIAIVTVGLALAGLDITSDNGIREEIRAVRAEIQSVRAEGRADRQALRDEARADREAIRAEARADREAIRAEARADREAFEKHITRLTQGQSRLTGIVEQMRTARR